MHAMRRHRYFAAGAAFYSLTALSTAFADLKVAGTCEAAMATASPVCRFRPVRAARSLVVNFQARDGDRLAPGDGGGDDREHGCGRGGSGRAG